MAYLLRLNTNGYAQLASTFSVASADSLSVIFKASFNGLSEIYGLNTSTAERLQYTGSGFFLRLAGTNGNTITTATIAGLVSGYDPADPHKYELRKIPFEDGLRTKYRLYVDDVHCGELLSIYGSGGATFQFNRIGSASSTFFNGDLYYLDCYVNGTKTRSYDPDATGGSGSTLVDTTGSQNGTLNGTYSWVFYNTGIQPIYLNVIGASGKYVTCDIPQPALDSGRALQVEYEDEFEVRRTTTDWPLVSTNSIGTTDLIFLRSGSDVEIRSTGNTNWIVTTGVDLTQFHVFKFRTTFDGATINRQLYVDGVLKGTTTTLSNPRMGAMAAFFGLATSSARSGDFKYFKRTDFVNSANSREYNAGASGGVGNIIPELLYSLHGVQQGTWPADNLEWVSYSTGGGGGGTSFTGTIGKTTLAQTTQALSLALGSVLSPNKQTLSPSVKQLSINAGLVLSPNKQPIGVNNKQLGVVAGVSLGVGKQVLTLNTKPEFVQAGAVVTNGKQTYPLTTKQLAVVISANVPFIATINKSSYSLSGKQLAIQAGWNSSVLKDSLVVQNKQEGVNAGALFDINEQQLTLSKKGLSLTTGTSISFIGELNKANLNAVGKPLSVVTGTSIPFTGLIQKTSLTLSGKALTRANGHILQVQKQSLNLVNKQLSVGETIYPIIPVERLFTIKDGDRVYLMKQTTTIYIMKNN